ncbi:acyltransferase [Marisediminicola sp. LYQ85]|uniref:acyltransferase n=1 Tax=Marisediminicola sp. LYQ85 TaxID=3391062 RepID=UPI00398318E3
MNWRAGNGEVLRLPVTIGDGAWVGARAIILPGVTIGSGCVIAAGSIVRADCAPNTMWAGIPAALKRRLDTND